MREMIHDTLKKVKSKLKTEIKDTCFCSLKTIRFDNGNIPDYTKQEIQYLYLLRYYPAYLCEYKYLYQKVLSHDGINNLSILSIGCGCGIDYHGAFLASDNNIDNISYFGIDIIDWEFIDSLENPNFKITISDIKDIVFPAKNDYNVIIFPKSLSEFDKDSFDYFLQKLSKSEFTQENIFLISSAMEQGFQYDEIRYQKVSGFLENIGYICENYSGTMGFKNKGGLNNIDSDFDYPNDIKNYIESLSNICKEFIKNGENCKDDCSVQLNKSPILTARYVSFQINHFKKKI